MRLLLLHEKFPQTAFSLAQRWVDPFALIGRAMAEEIRRLGLQIVPVTLSASIRASRTKPFSSLS